MLHVCKVQHQGTQAEETTLQSTSTTNEFISMDLIGEFHPPSSKGNRYALTAICMLTGFTFCIPLKSKTAKDVVTAYMDNIYCVFGPSRRILTDNGTEFRNKFWEQVFKDTRMSHLTSPIYSPQCNGRIEGFHKFLKATIGKQLQEDSSGTT